MLYPNLGYIAHCHNGVQDCDETLVDCGGAFCKPEFGCPGASGKVDLLFSLLDVHRFREKSQ